MCMQKVANNKSRTRKEEKKKRAGKLNKAQGSTKPVFHVMLDGPSGEKQASTADLGHHRVLGMARSLGVDAHL